MRGPGLGGVLLTLEQLLDGSVRRRHPTDLPATRQPRPVVRRGCLRKALAYGLPTVAHQASADGFVSSDLM
jgi:hypothetical protein